MFGECQICNFTKERAGVASACCHIVGRYTKEGKTMKRLTKIYEDCEGFIRAVAFEDEKAVNIITLATDIEPSGLTGGKVLEAAKTGWPDARQFTPGDWSNWFTIDQVAENLDKSTESSNRLIAEISEESNTFYWSNMGHAGLELFEDLDEVSTIAFRVRSFWSPADCYRLCEKADIEERYTSAKSEDAKDAVVREAAAKLDICIGTRPSYAIDFYEISTGLLAVTTATSKDDAGQEFTRIASISRDLSKESPTKEMLFETLKTGFWQYSSPVQTRFQLELTVEQLEIGLDQGVYREVASAREDASYEYGVNLDICWNQLGVDGQHFFKCLEN